MKKTKKLKALKPGKIPGLIPPPPKLKPLTPGRLPGQAAPEPSGDGQVKPQNSEAEKSSK